MFSRNMFSRNMFSRNECFPHFVFLETCYFYKHELFLRIRTWVAFPPVPLSMVLAGKGAVGPEPQNRGNTRLVPELSFMSSCV